MDKENSRNTIIFVVCTIALLALYEVFIVGPRERQHAAEMRAQAVQTQMAAQAGIAPGGPTYVTRAQALALSPRVPINTPALEGSIALKGGRIDDLFLKDYRETIAKTSPPVELFRPEGAKDAYFTDFGWSGPTPTPGPLTLWRQTGGGTLAPCAPVTLSWDNGQGLTFTRTISVDKLYMFTVADAVTNHGSTAIKLAPYASVQRQGQPELSKSLYVFEGAIGVFSAQPSGGKYTTKSQTYKGWKKKGDQTFESTGGWFGLTDKYWLAVLVPSQTSPIKAQYRIDTVDGVDVFETDYVTPPVSLSPGATVQSATRVFAGAKKVAVLQAYQAALGIPRFDDAVDWGWLFLLTRPIFWLLIQLYHLTGNFGLALLALTVIVKAATFPLANKSYASASKMKLLAPEIDKIKKLYKDDAAKQQQETMALYQREKINPVAGCLPALIPLPIFFALYQVLFVTIEMRQAPFFGFIKDLSDRDPTSVWTLFGLIPWHPETAPLIGTIIGGNGPLHIGFLALLYGFIMWLNQAMTPTTGIDPAQRQIMQFMPLMFIFFFTQMPAGLLVYYCWSTALTIAQQYFIMHRYKTENPIDNFIAKLRGRGGGGAAPAKT
jgi:YidC/Oxa1 family membrane protein insertase